MLAVIVGIGSTIFGQFAGGFNNPPTIDDALTLILAALALLGLSIFGPGIANGLIAGGPQLGAGAAVGTGLAAPAWRRGRRNRRRRYGVAPPGPPSRGGAGRAQRRRRRRRPFAPAAWRASRKRRLRRREPSEARGRQHRKKLRGRREPPRREPGPRDRSAPSGGAPGRPPGRAG